MALKKEKEIWMMGLAEDGSILFQNKIQKCSEIKKIKEEEVNLAWNRDCRTIIVIEKNKGKRYISLRLSKEEKKRKCIGN